MDRIVLDTDILIDYAKGYVPWIDTMLEGSTTRLVLPTISIAEFYASQTMEDAHEVDVAEKTFALFVRMELTEKIAKTLGGLLRRKSYPPGAGIPDLIVAATAVYLGASLATRNTRHFRGIPGLRFFHPNANSSPAG